MLVAGATGTISAAGATATGAGRRFLSQAIADGMMPSGSHRMATISAGTALPTKICQVARGETSS